MIEKRPHCHLRPARNGAFALDVVVPAQSASSPYTLEEVYYDVTSETMYLDLQLQAAGPGSRFAKLSKDVPRGIVSVQVQTLPKSGSTYNLPLGRTILIVDDFNYSPPGDYTPQIYLGYLEENPKKKYLYVLIKNQGNYKISQFNGFAYAAGTWKYTLNLEPNGPEIEYLEFDAFHIEKSPNDEVEIEVMIGDNVVGKGRVRHVNADDKPNPK